MSDKVSATVTDVDGSDGTADVDVMGTVIAGTGKGLGDDIAVIGGAEVPLPDAVALLTDLVCPE